MFKRFSIPFFALFALTSAVFLPACDEGSDAELAEQLGLSVEELDALSAEELDALERPSELGTPVVHTHEGGPLASSELGTPVVHTHEGGPLASSELGTPVVHTHGSRPLILKVPTPPPTHAEPASVVVSATPDEGCDTHGDELELVVR